MTSSRLTASSRRLFLQRLAMVGAATATGQLLNACSSGSAGAGSEPGLSPMPTTPVGSLAPGHVDGRILILVDLRGGNDGLSMVVPAGSPRYFDQRPNLAIGADSVLALNERIGLNPRLTGLHRRGVTVVEGVGAWEHELSHFAMAARWEQGDVTGSHSLRTGFGGRLTDVLAQAQAQAQSQSQSQSQSGTRESASPAVGVSLAGPAPILLAQDAPTISLRGLDDLWMLAPTDWDELLHYQEALASFAPSATGDSYRTLLDLGRKLADVDESSIDWDDTMLSDGGELGEQLWLAGDLISANIGTRVIATQLGGFDTHEGHEWRHDELMVQLDAAIDGFYRRAEQLGFADRVVIATHSEFGRRVRENDGGLDHGSASAMLVAGPIEHRILGQPTDVDTLDEDGNLVVSTGFDQYFGSLAEQWLGVSASSVLPSTPELLNIA